MSPRLVGHADIIEQFDEAQLAHCINSALNFTTNHGIPVVNPEGVLALADYVNQYGSLGDGAAAYFSGLGHSVTGEDVLQFKLTETKYGKEHPDDCKRRYANIAKVMEESNGQS